MPPRGRYRPASARSGRRGCDCPRPCSWRGDAARRNRGGCRLRLLTASAKAGEAVAAGRPTSDQSAIRSSSAFHACFKVSDVLRKVVAMCCCSKARSRLHANVGSRQRAHLLVDGREGPTRRRQQPLAASYGQTRRWCPS